MAFYLSDSDSEDYLGYSSDDSGLSSHEETDDELETGDFNHVQLASDFARACAVVPLLSADPGTLTAEEIEEDAGRALREAEFYHEQCTRSRQLSTVSSTSTLFESADSTFSPKSTKKSKESSSRAQTRGFIEFLGLQDDVAVRFCDIIDFMHSKQVNLTVFLWALCGGIPELKAYPKLRYALSTLLHSKEFSTILDYMHYPPRKHGRGIRTKGAKSAAESWALKTVNKKIGTEMRSLRPLLRLPTCEISEDALLSISLDGMIRDVQNAAPTLWSILRAASLTKRQAKRNTMKTPDSSILMSITQAAYSRSCYNNKMQQLNTVYLKASGASAKSLDTLNTFGITMSQKTAYRNITAIAEASEKRLHEYISNEHAFFLSYDNLNMGFRIYEQRLAKHSHFDSGTAATVYTIADPTVKLPSNLALQAQISQGSKNPITFEEIRALEARAAPRLREQAIYIVLRHLIDAPAFHFSTYEFKSNPVFFTPAPILQLPTGPGHATQQFMLRTMKIDESSLAGNEAVLEAIFKQLNITTGGERQNFLEDHVIIIIGDQLTVVRIRGVKKNHCADLNSFERHESAQEVSGWFHLGVTFEHNLYDEYYAKQGTPGSISQAATLLGRKGLGSTSVKGTWHHDMREAVLHIAAAHFRDLWCLLGKVQQLGDLRDKSAAELHMLATQIVDHFASTIAVSHLMRAEQQDDILKQSVQWNRDVLDYLILDSAMTSGDVGLMELLLPRLLYRFIGGGNSNYVVEVLEMLQGLHHEWPEDTRNFIQRYYKIQEQNIRDIKHTFAAIGPFATWEGIAKMSAAIPTQRKIKDHVEADFNHFRRGKSHTIPDAEADICLLQKTYSSAQIHENKGRLLSAPEKAKGHRTIGSLPTTIKAVIQRWTGRRTFERSTEQSYEGDSTPEGSESGHEETP
ncbi:hypothetical protein NM688_g3332 [Phlebia brevispora]|uniref:Uncharacterized protein n=1 Tax=Phlebia brevispora TaxID=194682 RepID=A0ACC1T5U3_9APHY|nr:hypothetical protein NM688_g3332 [Phlebia brevispora]